MALIEEQNHVSRNMKPLKAEMAWGAYNDIMTRAYGGLCQASNS